MESITLKYGRATIAVEIPDKNNGAVLRLPAIYETPLTMDDFAALMENPSGTAPLREIVKPGESVTILVSDITRYTGAEIFLPVMIEKMNDAGVADNDITILFTNGIHRKLTNEEKRRIVGDAVYEKIKCIDHDARHAEMTTIGLSLFGEPVRLNKLATECDKLIVTGSVGHHYLAGFGGGGKAVMPGVAGYDDAARFHFLSMNPDGPGRHPRVTTGVLDGNPMNEFAMKVLESAHPAFMLNTVANPKSQIVAATAGESGAAFAGGVEIARRMFEVPVKDLADVVVVSCGGYPKDINFIQAHKTYDNAVRALKPGGKLFIAAMCEDGAGSDTFTGWFRYGSVEEIEKKLRENFQINGQTALATAIKSAGYETWLLSSLDTALVRSMGMRPVASKSEFIKSAKEAMDSAERWIIIPEGGYLLPKVVKIA